MSELLAIGNLQVAIRRSDRRKTVGVTIERDGSVVATVPAGLPLPEVSRTLRKREVWLHSALARREALTPTTGTKEYVSGEGFYYLGRAYRLRVIHGACKQDMMPDLELSQGRFRLRGDCAAKGHECFVRWYTERAQGWLGERMPQLQRRVGVEVRDVAVMDLGFRWASCSETGRLNFHWRAILLPPALVTYVALHELCHLIEHNHTDRFWALVRRVDHDFEKKEAWLRENGARFAL